MFKVMIRDNMSPVARKILEESGEFEVVVDNDKATNDPARLSEIIAAFDALAIRSGTRVDPQVLAREMVIEVEHPSFGPLRQVDTAIKVTDGGNPRRPAPALGADTDRVLKELLAYSDAEIDALEKSELNLFTDTVYRECFQWFGFGALFCLVLGLVLDTTVLRRTP